MKRYTVFPNVITNDNKFKECGFEKINLSNKMLELLYNFKMNPSFDQTTIDTLMNCMEQELKSWASQNIIMDTEIITVDAVYRDTDPKNKNMFVNIPLAHIDFDSFMNDASLLDPFMDRWGPRLYRKLGSKVYDPRYWNSGKNIVKICNTWVSLNDKIENHHLGLIDIRTINHKNVIEYIAKRSIRKDSDNFLDNFGSRKETFIATALRYDNNNKWYYDPEMKFGSAIIFDSKNTAHASMETSRSNETVGSTETVGTTRSNETVGFEGTVRPEEAVRPEGLGGFGHRKSIEFRTIFVKKDVSIPREIVEKYYSISKY
jgi:hypothetical protein